VDTNNVSRIIVVPWKMHYQAIVVVAAVAITVGDAPLANNLRSNDKQHFNK
jgi:hypothetical protein